MATHGANVGGPVMSEQSDIRDQALLKEYEL
jgi:hypothetical protein